MTQVDAVRATAQSTGDLRLKQKPRLRGIPDVIALVGFVPAAVVLVVVARPGVATLAAGVYAASLVALFAVSALYHTPRWPLHVRMVWKRLDHSMIYVLIAGCYTPACLLVFPEPTGSIMLAVVWAVTALGFLKSFVWPTSPRALNTTIYVAMGWLIAPHADALQRAMGDGIVLIAAGGVLYTVGALIYVKRWPNPVPHFFGYHEVFHLFVVAAAACQYIAFYGLLT